MKVKDIFEDRYIEIDEPIAGIFPIADKPVIKHLHACAGCPELITMRKKWCTICSIKQMELLHYKQSKKNYARRRSQK